MSRPWRTLRGRLALGSLAGLLVASVLFVVLGVGLTRTQTVAAELQDLERTATAIAKLMSEDAQRQIQAESRYRPSKARIAALDEIGGSGTQLLYQEGVSLDPGSQSTGALPRGIFARRLAPDGPERFDYTIPQTGLHTIAVAAPIRVAGKRFGAVVLLRDRSEVASAWQRVAKRVLIAAGIGLLIALGVVLLLTRRVTRPLTRLRTAAERVGRGELDVHVPPGGTEEVDAVATAFNAMVRELAHKDALARDFLMHVTHDLRTPLTAIRGHVQALADGVVPDGEMPRSLAAIDDESSRLEALITDLLDLAKLEARRFRLDLGEIDANELLERAFDGFAGEAARRGVAYEKRTDQLPVLLTDAARVRQIIGNLLDNALRWTPDRGTVRLEARRRPAGGAVIIVADTGPGIQTERLDAIFEPFLSTETPGGQTGHGLGLAISRQLAIALGGDLTVESRPGAGSRFTLELPSEAHQLTPIAF